MKNNKLFNYLFILFASFISSVCVVKAITITPDTKVPFGSKFYFSKCDNPDPEHFTISGSDSNWSIEYHTYDENIKELKFSCTGYQLGNKPDEKNWTYTLNVSDKEPSTQIDSEGNVEGNFNITAESSEYNFCNGGSNCNIEIANDGDGTISTEGETIKINKGDISNNVQGKITVTYTKDGTTYKNTINIVVPEDFGGARIYPGDNNLCKIDTSVWKAKDYVDSAGAHHRYYQAKGDETFPTCSGENSVYPLEFKGWVPTTQNEHITNLHESCSGMVSGTTADSTGSYYACYEAKPTIQIAVEANVSNPQDWKKVSGMGYYYVGSNTDEVQLPELSFIGFNKKNELDYWENNKGEKITPDMDENGKYTNKSQVTVPLDGSVWKAVIKTSSTIDIRGYERNIYVGKVAVFSSVTDKITNCGSSSEGIIEAKMVNGECQVIGLKETNGEYSAKVFATTDKDETINYNVKVSSNYGSQNGDTAFEIDPNANENFEVVKPNKVVTEEKNTNSSSPSLIKGASTLKKTCTKYKFSYTMYNFKNRRGTIENYFHVSNRIGSTLIFKAYCVPESGKFGPVGSDSQPKNAVQYDSLCLEENKTAPNNDYVEIDYNPLYVIESTLDDLEKNSVLKFVINYIVQNYYYDSNGNPTNALRNGQDYRFITAQILTRLAWIADGNDSINTSKNSQYYYHLSYREVAPYFFNENVAVGSPEWNEKVIGKDGNAAESEGNFYVNGKYYGGAEYKKDSKGNIIGFTGTGLGMEDYKGADIYDNVIKELEKVHNAYVEAKKVGLEKYLDTTSGEGFVGNEVPNKNSDGENNPVYETNGTNIYTLTYEGNLLVTEKFEDRNITLEACQSYPNIECEVIQNPTYSGDKDSDGNLIFKYIVKIKVTDAANVKVPVNAADKDKASFRILVDGKNLSFNDAFILQPDNQIKAHEYQRMLVFRPDATDAEAKLYFPFVLIPNLCKDVPATSAENYGNADFNSDLFTASGCCNDVTDDVTYQPLLEQVCQNKCTTSTFTNVCRWKADNEDNSELYLIKEGSIYNGSKNDYKNQIGSCIADVEHDYSVNANKPFFQRTDDNANSINVVDYKDNKYCQVTCKEDWTISMDSFGNYVGVKAIAAGTSFAINNDMFIGGERTCYTSYVNTDRYMDDMTKLSSDIVKQYNIYSNNSHAYTDINGTSGSDVKAIPSEQKCVLWDVCPTGTETKYSWNGSKCVGTKKGKDTVTSETYCPVETIIKDGKEICPEDLATRYKHSFSCEADTLKNGGHSGTVSGTPPSPSSVTNSTSTEMDVTCTYEAELNCKSYGYYYEYELSTKNDVDSGKYDRYEVENDPKVSDGFNKDVYIQNKIKNNKPTESSYARTEKIGCEYSANKGENLPAGLTCNFSTFSSNNMDGSPSISGDVSPVCKSPHDDNGSFCNLGGFDLDEAHGLLVDVSTKATSDVANAAKDQLSNLYINVNNFTTAMYQCQNFYLYNVSTPEDIGQIFTPDYNPLGIKSIGAQPVRIDTKFDPAASYKYDEAEFMTLLGKDNVIEEFKYKNESIMSDYYSSNPTERSVDAKIKAFDKYGNEYDVSDVKLQRNNVIMKYYNDSPWAKETDNYNNYVGEDEKNNDDYVIKTVIFCTAGNKSDEYADNGNLEDPDEIYVGATEGTTEEWDGGQCYPVKVKYREAHYISSYIGNSSFYHNKGNWYMNTATDIKEHGDDKRDAIANANSRSSSLNYSTTQDGLRQWSLLNGTTQNVFPVSLTTPRNLYQYTYSFKNIGYYSDGELGRIMGEQNSIISANSRTCFYEIYEDVCLCCGSKITTHADNEVDPSKIEQLGNGTGQYNYSKSDESKIGTNSSGTLKIIPSTVGLSDLASKYGSSNVNIPTNWSSKAPFMYNGAKYYTDKGDYALKQIQKKGEHIYADTAEYSYYLTPDTLAAIREYNDVNGYEINSNNLRIVADSGIYGYALDASKGSNMGAISNSDDNKDNYVMFQHYGSKFLENEMWSYNAVLDNTLAQANNNKVCYVEANNVNDVDSLVKNGCRFVDYIQKNNPVDGKDLRNENVPFRLAFK